MYPQHPLINSDTRNRLLNEARHELNPKVADRVSPEDVLQSLYVSLFLRSCNKGLPELPRDELVALLLWKIRRHAWKHNRRERAGRRCTDREERLDKVVEKNNRVWDLADHRTVAPSSEMEMEELLVWLRGQLSELEWHVFEMSLEERNKLEIAEKVYRGVRHINRILQKVKNLISEYGKSDE